MVSAKDIILRQITAQEANALVRRVHYSGKVVNNSQLHIGVFLNGKLEGAMQFGPSLDKRKVGGLVEGTGWNEFLELNRLAFSDRLPRNSESRALGVALRLLRKNAPHVKWVVSFADAAQCGDGAIYRAAGFALTGIKKNSQVWIAPNGEVTTRVTVTKGGNILETGGASMKSFKAAGFKPLSGFQLRYIYFIDKTYKERLTVPILPFTEIDRLNARMYKGKRATSETIDTSDHQSEEGGAAPTVALQSEKVDKAVAA